MNQALIIFNPTAGQASKQDVLKLVKKKLTDLDYQSAVLKLDFDFEAKIGQRDLSAVRLVLAVGGDGTVKVAAREIISRQINSPLLIIPFGSANVLASTLQLPLNIKDSLALLDKMKTEKIDVCRINRERYFLVGFSLGYISSIIIHTEGNLKRRFGSLGYIVHLFWNKIRMPRIKFRVETQNRVFWVKGNSLVIFNAFRFYGFSPKKPISIKDGIINLYVVTNKTFLTMLEAAFGMIFYVNPPKHIFALDNKYFKIKIRRKKYLKTAQIDGDRIKLPRNIEVEVLPRALEIVVK